MELIIMFGLGVLVGMYLTSQIEKKIDNDINNKNNK